MADNTNGRSPEPEDTFNVSHVVPAPPYFGPAPPDAQFPPTVDGQRKRLLMLEYLDGLRHRDETDRLISRLANTVDELKRVVSTLGQGAADPVIPPHRNRGKPEWSVYSTFRLELCELERLKRAETDHVTKEHVAGLAGCHPRTITRRMNDFGLDPRLWPPSAWPEKPPKFQHHFLDGLAHVLAAALPAIGLLDMIADGRYDMVLNMMRIFGCQPGVNFG